MMKHQSASTERILQALEAGPLSLAEVAAAVDLTPPPVHRQLGQLAAQGIIQKQGEQRKATYTLKPRLSVEWAHREQGPDAVQWFRDTWTMAGTVDWRFPLLSRIPDDLGRRTVRRFLENAWERGFFTPWLLPYLDPEANGANGEWADLDAKTREHRSRDPRNHGGVTFVAHGSCVTGDARDDSDIDLIALTPVDTQEAYQWTPQFPYDAVLADLADEINLGAPRTLDLLVVAEDHFMDGLDTMPNPLRESIIKTGITVYASANTPQYLELQRREIAEGIAGG